MTPRWIKRAIPWSVRHWFNARTRRRPVVTPTGDKFSRTATQDDIRYCYRILLGRPPDPDGWKTYEALVRDGQMSVEALAFHFLSSSEFGRRSVFQTASRPKPIAVDLGSFKLYVWPDDFEVGRALSEDGSYEPHVTAAMQRHLGPGKIVVDLGANIGYFSLMAAAMVGSTGRVVSFEPDQASCALLLKSAELNGFQNIEVYPFAVADKRKALILTGTGSHAMTVDPDPMIDRGVSGTLVVAVTLDEMLRDMDRIDVIKMDIEGAEFQALEGAVGTLRTHRPIIFSEYHPAALRNVSKVSGEEYLRRLIQERYEISVIRDGGRLLPCGSDIQRVEDAVAKAPATHIDIVAFPARRLT